MIQVSGIFLVYNVIATNCVLTRILQAIPIVHKIIGYCYTLPSYAFYTTCGMLVLMFDAYYAVIHIFVVLLSITCIFSQYCTLI